jgi:replicative DNA helicase
MTAKLYDLELERKLLGSVILRPELLLSLEVSDQDFYNPGHAEIWRALIWLQAEGEGIDSVRLHERLSSVNKLQAVGGHDYLLGLTDTVPSALEPPTKRIRELTRLRLLKESAQKLVATCDEGDLEKSLSWATATHAWASEAADTQIVTGLDCATLVLEELSGQSKRVLRVYPGLQVFSDAVGDLAVGSLTVVGAQNNVGKSSVALEMCAGLSARGVVCGYSSHEDPKVLVGTRLLSMYSNISARRIERRDITPEQWRNLSAACAQLQNLSDRFLISAQVGGSQLDACTIMTRMAQRGAKLVIMDYLQAISYVGEQAQDRRNEVRKVCQALKKQAARLSVALVLLSQLRRPEKGNENREPTKHDLKEAGDIEDAAENIVLMWREEEADFAPIRMKLAKGKSGGLGQRWSMQRSTDTGRLVEVRTNGGE